MTKNIVLLPGDGIGPEIVTQAKKVLDKVAAKFKHTFNYQTHRIGGDAIDHEGTPLSDKTVDACKQADAILLGAVGGPKWEAIDPLIRPERGLLKIRKELGLFANIRPTKLFAQLKNACPLREDIVANGIDFIVVRELTGGIYFGARKTETLPNGEKRAEDSMAYSESEIERIGRVAFELALKRNKKLCSIDKANVLDSSRLWREVMEKLSASYPSVAFSSMYVDNAAMQIIKNPAQFDVVVTENMFGDILSDEASTLAGSLGMMPSSSIASTNFGLYEPIHGSAPDIAGKNLGNPIGTILSAAMMLRYSFDMEEEAKVIEKAVETVLQAGYRTPDIAQKNAKDEKPVGTSQMGDAIANAI